MSDAAVYKLAKRAGVAVQWRDFAGRPHQVTVETLRRILVAMGLPCASPNDLQESIHSFEPQSTPALVTTTIGRQVRVPGRAIGQKVKIKFESGNVADVRAETAFPCPLPRERLSSARRRVRTHRDRRCSSSVHNDF
jgi:4-alpha-glucanotransferase